jgi:hypothetical protein
MSSQVEPKPTSLTKTRFRVPRVSFSVIGRDGCGFTFGIEFRDTDLLFNDHQAIYDAPLL